MIAKVHHNKLTEADRIFYTKLNKGWEATGDLLDVKMEDGHETTYVAFKGPYAKPYMAREMEDSYEINLGSYVIEVPKE